MADLTHLPGLIIDLEEEEEELTPPVERPLPRVMSELSQTHKRVHKEERPYQCDLCGKSFTGSGNLKKHQRVHTGEKPYQCGLCGKSFNQESNLRRHQRVHTGEKPYHCDQCGKSFNQESHLRKHQRVHTGEKPYHCDQCGKSFNQEYIRRTHQCVHTGEKLYQCGQCVKKLNQESHRRTHQQAHTRGRPYHCDHCGKSFKVSGDLKKHRRVHTGEKPYHCDQCGKSFSVESNLRSHQRVHIGEMPYHCDQCEKSFRLPGDLMRHQRVHTGEKPYHCDQCGKNFGSSTGLKKHLCSMSEFLVSVQKTEASKHCGLMGTYWLKADGDSLVLKDSRSRRSLLADGVADSGDGVFGGTGQIHKGRRLPEPPPTAVMVDGTGTPPRSPLALGGKGGGASEEQGDLYSEPADALRPPPPSSGDALYSSPADTIATSCHPGSSSSAARPRPLRDEGASAPGGRLHGSKAPVLAPLYSDLYNRISLDLIQRIRGLDGGGGGGGGKCRPPGCQAEGAPPTEHI